MVIGPVGSGKSTLLETILGNSNLSSGSATSSLSRVAYCPQIPWIQNNTIRQNIIGPFDFDPKWYDFTITACALEEDLKNMPGGDMRMAGSTGVSLSGGQKQRILKVVFLDNCFSGLDSKSINLIGERLFGKDGYFRNAEISVILATNTYRLLSYADEIISLEEGKVIDQGSWEQILARTPAINTKLGSSAGDISNVEDAGGQEEVDVGNNDASETLRSEYTDQLRQKGAWSVYMYYFRSAGYIPLAFFAIFTVVEAFCNNFGTIWLQWWVEANEERPNKDLGLYIGIYGLIFAASLAGLIAGCWVVFLPILNNTSLNMHSDLLRSAVNAPFIFFQSLDTGSTINRFSQDMELIDMMLPIYAVQFATGAITSIIKLVILCAVGKYLAGFVPVLAVALFLIQSYYLRTSRQVRLLDIEAKAPLYTHFLETIQGISSIRAFHWESKFQDQSINLLNQSQNPVYMLYCIQQWLTLVLDLAVGAIAVIVVAMITSMKDRFNPASIGVALNLLLTFNQALTQVIKMWTMTETSIGAVSRVEHFIKNTPSEERSLLRQTRITPQEWPIFGGIKFENLSAGYSLNNKTALKAVSLDIQPGEKIAICGSSGSGKTSLIMALLQMLEIQAGSIIVDDRDLSTIESNDIRARINVIPQQPFFMPGTVRLNLDPLERVHDELIESAIGKVGLWERVSANGGLDMEFLASEWSVGQKQLLALARALLSKSSILILDEATSSVDWETESIMQNII
ncbi:MAG: hypothetical protein M1818_001084 [Claussenomyces sp. TS43310]|nr:MAG: hypothetical protein M1818_001084 [Claussenomyces sp. TS43310]